MGDKPEEKKLHVVAEVQFGLWVWSALKDFRASHGGRVPSSLPRHTGDTKAGLWDEPLRARAVKAGARLHGGSVAGAAER